MKIDSTLLMESEAFVSKLLRENTPPYLGYHNLDHTREVVENAKRIAKHENFTPDETNILLTAAWFHDTGYVKTYSGHEQESIAIATGFLKKKKVDEAIIEVIANCIKATIYTQKPVSKIEKALRDADFMHLGKENYFEYAELIRREWNDAGVRIIKKGEFEEESVQMFHDHMFYTVYGRRELTGIKEKNLEILNASVKKRGEKKKKDKKSSGKRNTYSRGADSMLRLTARTQINLSSIADNKSNILISLNGIIISLGLAALVSRFKQDPAIILPTIIFLIFSLSTIVLAILSTRPNITTGKFTRADIEKKKVNLLFFGNFYNMPLPEYEWAIREMINDDKYLYAAMIKDQYYLGKVLAKKYKLLRWAYNIFMVGIVVSVIAFLLVFLPV
ncbi:MAG TPA: phosphohydrolase [Bacteroidales bacterium]|nr:phosphohydrolase [Bacteroidales bacterium]